MVRVLPAQEIPQQPCLPPGQRHHNHGAGLAGVHAGGVLLGRCASQCFRNEMPDGSGLEVMTVHTLRRFRLSIAVSTMVLRPMSPSTQYIPVCGP